MRRVLVAALASLVIGGLVAPAVAAAPPSDPARAVPKVVVIVGPSGAATNRYRAESQAAAALARRYTPDVTEIYSPNATWPAVKNALQGASLVIYMGHGNGWPSMYRDSLYPPTQNGFGLNPAPGGNDYKHQYFGEALIARDVNLAKNAVVLLNHLCYASGNSEPGIVEGTLAMARQRVDNFAAGFIKAGAAAVVAEAWSSPDHMVGVVLGGRRSIDKAWREAPSANGNVFAFESSRSKGYIAQMDPERDTSGFTRSIVLKRGLAAADVLRSARGSDDAPATSAAAAPVDAATLVPSLLGTGVELATPVIQGSTSIDGKFNYKIPFRIADRDRLPKGLQASARWDLLEASGVAVETPSEEPARSVPEIVSPDFGLVTAERPGDLIAPAKLRITRSVMAVHVATPDAPGRYRLTITLHDRDGVAYDPVTQAQVPPLIVRVTGDIDAGVDAPTRLHLEPGATVDLPVWVANLGKTDWGHVEFDDGEVKAEAARLTGSWVALGGSDATAQAAAAASVTSAELPAGFKPRAIAEPRLRLLAPSVAGDYLLVLDIVTPEAGSLTARGVEPAIIRVTVGPSAPAATAPITAPAAAPSAAPAAATEGASAASEAAAASSAPEPTPVSSPSSD